MKLPTTPCRICSQPTPMFGTKLCDRCWHLETRITADPDLSRRILAGLSVPNASAAGGAFIDVVFDGPPGPVSGRFVEAEDATGKSINAGEWIDRGNGLYALRIPQSKLAAKSEDPSPLADPASLAGLRCEEASIHSRETFIPCGAPAAAIVWHQHDGKHTYLMCAACAWHNVKNRGGRLLMTTDAAARP